MISRPNQIHMKQSDLGKSLDPNAGLNIHLTIFRKENLYLVAFEKIFIKQKHWELGWP